MSTEIQETITRLRELDRTASPAPWTCTDSETTWYGGLEPGDLIDSDATQVVPNIEGFCQPSDVDLIVEARNSLPDLLAEIDRLTAENLELKRENHLAWSKGHAAGWDCHIVTMQAADLLPKDQKTSSPYQEKK